MENDEIVIKCRICQLVVDQAHFETHVKSRGLESYLVIFRFLERGLIEHV